MAAVSDVDVVDWCAGSGDKSSSVHGQTSAGSEAQN